MLAGGLLLVLAGRVRRRGRHPVPAPAGRRAGRPGLFGAFSQTNRFNSGVNWLLPWSFAGRLGRCPARCSATRPPARTRGARRHRRAGRSRGARADRARRPARTGLVGAGALAVALICLAGVAQLRPVPTAGPEPPGRGGRRSGGGAALHHHRPGHVLRLPRLRPRAAALRGPVSGVLAHLPARPAQPLTRSAGRCCAPRRPHPDPRPHPAADRRMGRADADGARAMPPRPAIYLPVGSWPAGGGRWATRSSTWRWGRPSGRSVCRPPPAAQSGQPVRNACRSTRPGRRSRSGWPSSPPTPPRRAAGRPAGFGAAGSTRWSAAPWSRPGSIPAGWPDT